MYSLRLCNLTVIFVEYSIFNKKQVKSGLFLYNNLLVFSSNLIFSKIVFV